MRININCAEISAENVWKFLKKSLSLQTKYNSSDLFMTYILQKTEIKNAPRKLVEMVKQLGVEKHAKMEELRSKKDFTISVSV